jgi:hypothetical protein
MTREEEEKKKQKKRKQVRINELTIHIPGSSANLSSTDLLKICGVFRMREVVIFQLLIKLRESEKNRRERERKNQFKYIDTC